MSWPFRRGRVVTFTNYTTNKRTQDRVVDPSRTRTYRGCAFNPGGTFEGNAPGVTVTSTPTVYGPYDLDLDPTGTVVIDGEPGVWEVDGEIRRWRNDLTGTKACAEVSLTRKRGAA